MKSIKSNLHAVSAFLDAKGVSLSYSEKLELLARANGYPNWNTAQSLEQKPSLKLAQAPLTYLPAQAPEGLIYVWECRSEHALPLETLKAKLASAIEKYKLKDSAWAIDWLSYPDKDGVVRSCQMKLSNLGAGSNVLLVLVAFSGWVYQNIESTRATWHRFSYNIETPADSELARLDVLID